MDRPRKHSCDFCSKTKDQVEKLILGDGVAICNECVSLCSGMLNEDKIKRFPANENKFKYNPVNIKEYLDQHVIAQDAAKTVLSVAVCQHFKRTNNPVKHIHVEKSNVMLLGPTGSGKTELVRRLAEYLNIPFVICDATTITEAGYVGEDADSILSKLLAAADYDVKAAEKGIIYIDEIDKLARKNSTNTATRDVGGEGVQQALLKILEGSRVSVAAQHSKKHSSKDTVELDTADILFICGGAFVGLEQQIKSRMQQHTSKVGFGAELAIDHPATHGDVTVRDLISYGMIPEFVSRFSMITHVDTLTEQQLIRVLKEPKHNLIAQYQYLFELDGIELKFEEEALATIAQSAIAQEINARGLRSILETTLLPYQFDAVDLNARGLTRITITRDTVQGGPALLAFANLKSARSV